MKKIILTIATALVLTFYAEAQTQRIATVNMRIVFDGYFKTKQADNEIKKRATEFDVEGKKYQDEYRKLTEEYNAALARVDDPTITAEVKAQRTKNAEDKIMEIKKLETVITQFERSARTALSEQQKRLRDNIMKDILDLIAKRAKSEKYSKVIDSGAESADRSPILLYTDNEDDLTEDILKLLNANAPADILRQMEESPVGVELK
ncbi:MAG: OmpH family outer membrane protein [Limisphaerales bacterium]|jgi:outer membrane protein|nr:OmpH family outer membrane protein [Verrucomicrobiota bacterium]